MVELNTLLPLPKDFDPKTLEVGKKYNIVKNRERAFPLRIAVLLVDADWNFYGYCRVNRAIVKDLKTEFDFEMLSLFSEEEKAVYRKRFIEAAKMTGEIK